MGSGLGTRSRSIDNQENKILTPYWPYDSYYYYYCRTHECYYHFHWTFEKSVHWMLMNDVYSGRMRKEDDYENSGIGPSVVNVTVQLMRNYKVLMRLLMMMNVPPWKNWNNSFHHLYSLNRHSIDRIESDVWIVGKYLEVDAWVNDLSHSHSVHDYEQLDFVMMISFHFWKMFHW